MDLIDLTRILGILLIMQLKRFFWFPMASSKSAITGNACGCSYTIRNSVTPRTIQQGIHAGISTKGEGRGKGLSTVRELLSPYHNATLNSCLQGDIFIQSLTLSWQDPLS